MSSQPNIETSKVASIAQLIDEGQRALSVGHFSHAERLFRHVVQLEPLSATAWRGLAETQFGSRRGICLRWAEYAEMRCPAARFPTTQKAQHSYRPSRWTLAGAAAALMLVIGSDVAYRDRMLPGVNVSGVDIGSMKRQDAEKLLVQHEVALNNKPVQLQTNTRHWQVAIGELLEQSPTSAGAAAFAYGHEQSFVRRALIRLRAFAGYQRNFDITHADDRKVHELVSNIAAEVNHERRDAQLIKADNWQLLPEQAGIAVNQGQVRSAIAALIDTAEQQNTLVVDIPVTRTNAERTSVQLEPVRQQLTALAQQPLLVQLDDKQWTLDRSMLMHIDNNAGAATLAPSRMLIEQQLVTIADEVAVAPQSSQLVREGNRVRSITPARPGRELDREAAYQAVLAALISGADSINLPVQALPPVPGEAEQLGLVAEIGRGVSQFKTYSSPERDANVQTGGNEIDGVLIAPGEVFSFTGTIRDITWEEGYRWGEMIEAGVIVPSLGGGICQVSTTVFRAAFWSGLEIVERHNHTWRLAWYEVDAPPGMDATIALGGPDLKFRNNTGHHLLLKVETDLERKQQTVIMYGTPDGRNVTMDAIAGGNIGVKRNVVTANGAVANETYLSYYTQ